MPRPEADIIKDRENLMQTIADCADSPSTFSKEILHHDGVDYNKKYVDCKDR